MIFGFSELLELVGLATVGALAIRIQESWVGAHQAASIVAG